MAERDHRAMAARIRGLLPSLTASEAAVGRVVLDRGDEIVRTSIESVARQAGVSTTTVLRFCQSLGFDGFKDFKFGLVTDGRGGHHGLPDDVTPDDSAREVVAKVLQSDIEAIRDTLELLDTEAFEASVDALNEARRIEVYGIGTSAPIAVDAFYRFLRIGLPVSVVTDSHMQAVSAGLLGAEDVALVISHTGRTPETLAAARTARTRGATVIGLTSFPRTPLGESSDLHLVTATGETAFRVEAMASPIAQFSVVDALYVALAMRRREVAAATLERTSAIVERKRTRVSERVKG